MQLIKRSRKNQVVIPKAILAQAGVGPDDAYLKIDYNRVLGAILLRPVAIEEKISTAALERFEAKLVKGQPGDRRYPSMRAALKSLQRLHKKRR
ncbi:MAG: hypothetical protein HYZ92_01255 [Candidatus Omnitrophica bacterium]|nr:hypothetical protein [Candidatus Omnitrophota bacterium]